MNPNSFKRLDFRSGASYQEPFVLLLEGVPATPAGLLYHNLNLLGQGEWPLTAKVATFLLTAIAIWAADKAVRRQTAADGWTRRLWLSLPAGALAGQLATLEPVVHFLTGDHWQLTGRPDPLPQPPPAPTSDWHPTVVCLFSGGMDSLIGAIDLLEAGHRCLLVSHYDYGQLAGSQKVLAQALQNFYGPERVWRWGFRVQFEAPELTLRSRSLLYLALGLAPPSGRRLHL